MKKLIQIVSIGLVLFLTPILVHAQQEIADRADSLRKSGAFKESIPLYDQFLANVDIESEEYLKYSVRLGIGHLMLGNSGKALENFNNVMEQTNDDTLNIYRMYAINNIGMVYDNQGRFDESIRQYQRARVLYQHYQDSFLVDVTIMNQGVIEKKQGKYKEAIENLTLSAEGFIKRGNDYQLSEVYTTLGLIQEELGDNDKAMSFYTQSLEICKNRNDIYGIGGGYTNIGGILRVNGQLDSALVCLKKGVALMRSINGRNLGIALHNLGLCYVNMGKDQLAKQTLSEALDVKMGMKDSNEVVFTAHELALFHLARNRTDSARMYLITAREYGAANKHRERLITSFGLWKEYYIQKGYPDSALYCLERVNQLEKQIAQESYLKELAFLQEEFEADEREFEIETLDKSLQESTAQTDWWKKNFWYIMLALGIVLIASTVVIVIVRLKAKNRALQSRFEGVESEKKRIARELHDAVNQRIDDLKKRLGTFGETLSVKDRAEVKNLVKRMDILSQEIVLISDDLYPPELEKFPFSIVVQDFLFDWFDTYDFEFKQCFDDIQVFDPVPKSARLHVYRFIQQGFRNILHHAQANMISLDVHIKRDSLVILIKDNGMGIETESQEGIGFRSFRERADLVGGQFEFQSDGEGTTITFSIPLKTKAHG